MTTVRIANAGGFWGDDPGALAREVRGGPLDYVTLDYLAEITMVILERHRSLDATKGYATDFVPAAAEILPELLAGRVRLVCNAGGVNPEACADALERVAKRMGLKPRIAAVCGSGFEAPRIAPANLETGEPFEDIAAEVESAHAYLGARGIADALKRGADVVIAGRVSDAALALGPLVHELGWSFSDWHRLAAGTVAGHILECGAQATGGNTTGWRAWTLSDIGYPIAEVDSGGDFVVTKRAGTGGRVSRETVTEQLLYEIGDPARYAGPDVTADFTSIRLHEEGPDRVRVEGVRGLPPPPDLKAGVTYRAGWKASGTYLVGPPDAREKADVLADLLWQRFGKDFDDVLTERFGGEEIFVRIAVRDRDRQKLERFSRSFASLALAGPPALTIPGGGRPPVQEVFGFWPARVPRDAVKPYVAIDGDRVGYDETAPSALPLPRPERARSSTGTEAAGGAPGSGTRLLELAYARSGDKGNSANIGVAARSEEAFQLLRVRLTPERVKGVFAAECGGDVVRYELPNLLAFNFVLERALGGGGTLSLRSDPQGKLFAQRLLMMEL